MSRQYRVLAVATVAVMLLAGCGRVAPTSPDSGLAPEGTSVSTGLPAAGNAPSAVKIPVVVDFGPRNTSVAPLQPVKDPDATPLEGTLQFVLDVVRLVLPGLETHIGSGRWGLDLHAGSLEVPKGISVAHASDGTVQVEFGPDGTQFGTPVDIVIDYSGTSVDPSSKDYVPGTRPVLLWWNPATKAWTEMPCTIDAGTHTVHGKLQHFSRYGVGGKAGW